MKKIYMILAVFALLSMSLNAQQLKADQFGNVVQPTAQTGKGSMKAPNRATITGSVTAADGTSTSTGYQYLPVYGYYFEQAQTIQMIYTATQLDGLQAGDKITSLTFYPRTQSGSVGTIGFNSGSITLSLGNTSISEFSSNAALSVSTTQVARVTSYPVSNGAWTITFTTPFTYTGQNILVQVNTTSGNYGATYFFGQDQSNYQSRNSYGSTNRYYFLPKIKLDYERSDDPEISANPTSVSLSSIPGATSTQTVTVSGLNLTTGITATISGTDASLFSVSPASLGTTGGSLTVTYSPTAIGSHTATLTLSSTGAQDVTITLNGECTQDLTICNGDASSSNLPVYGSWYDSETGQKNQMIYNASLLTSLVGKNITSMTFYAPNGIQFSGGSVTFSIGTTSTNAFSSATALTDNVTAVATVVPNGETEWTITFSSPYPYNGGNLLIQVDTQTGSYSSTSFTGMDMSSNVGYYSYTGYSGVSNNLTQILPEVTFTFEETGPKIVVSPETLTINDSGTNNTFTVQGTNLVDNNNGNVGVSASSSDFGLTFSSSTNTIQSWGFERNNGSVNGTVAVNYYGRALNATTTVTAATQGDSKPVEVTYVADLYIVTDNGVTGNWDFTNGTQMTNNDGVYTATFTATVDNTYILFARKLGESNPWNTRYVFGPDSGGDWAWGTYTGGNIDVNDDDPIVLPAGTYTVTINANDGTFTITKLVPDLAIALDAPAQVVGGNDATVTATVTNTGETPVTGYTVTITADGNTILTQTVNETLAVGATNELTVQYPTTAAQVGNTVNFAANVAYTDDGDATNNNATASMSIINMPAPENVVATGDSENQSATVTWDAPSTLPIQSVTEGFEDTSVFPPFSAGGVDATTHTGAFGDWTLYDATGGCIVYGSKEINFEHEGEPHAWFVFKPSEATADQDYPNAVAHDSYSGAQYLESICPTSGSTAAGQSDHWLISPELSGNAQTISFYVSELTTIWGDETYEIWVSTTDNTAPASFSKLGETYTVDHDTWEKQTVQLPEGTKYFAIRHTSNDIFGLLIDDVTYESVIKPVSYNVYLNGVLQGSVDANDPLTYDFSNLAAGEYTVEISAVYPGNIESAKESDTFTIVPKTATPTITYETTNATVVVTATGEGTVYLEVDGRVVSGEGSVSITIMRSLEDRTVTATATAVAPNSLPSDEATSNVPVPALAGGPAQAKEGLLRMHLLIVDQMKEDIPDDNSHPDRYGYVLKWEQPANVADRKKSGTVDVEIKKTEAQVNGYYTKTQVDNDIDHDNSELTMDVLTADVGMYLPGEDPTVLYYEMQAKKDGNPVLGEDYVTQLQYMKNAKKYEEMLETSPNKTHQYPAEETYHYFDDSTPIVTGTYGVNFMTYAPSVSTWGIQRRYFEEDGLDNTYGAPIWKTGVGRVRMIGTEAQLQRGPQGSTQWDGVGGPCSLVFLGVEAYGDLPSATVSNIVYEPYMFRVWIQSPSNSLRGYTFVPENQDPNKPGEHYVGDGTCYGADPVLIYQEETTDGHLYKDVEAPEVGNNVPWGSRIQFGALDSGISDLVVYVRFYYRSTGVGVSTNRDGETPEVPGYYATEGNGDPDITTGIVEMWNDFNYGEVESTTYVNAQGMTSDQPFDGVNIVVTRYTNGKVTTTKVIR